MLSRRRAILYANKKLYEITRRARSVAQKQHICCKDSAARCYRAATGPNHCYSFTNRYGVTVIWIPKLRVVGN